jgi:type IV secretory pathway TraG/TraD family ATPase VirD4
MSMSRTTGTRAFSPVHVPRSALALGLVLVFASQLALAQAQGSPFLTGATALQTNIIAWLTPIAVILVMVLGAMAMANRMNDAGEDRRLWFIVDELDSLGAIDGLKDALTRLRKFGGRCVLGFQSLAQVSATYGSADAQTLIENCGNTLILRCSGSEHGGTSQFASRLIGEREVIRRHTARGREREGLLARGARRSTNVSEQHVIEAAVLASQIEQLPDLCGYLKTAGSPAWLQVRIAARR